VGSARPIKAGRPTPDERDGARRVLSWVQRWTGPASRRRSSTRPRCLSGSSGRAAEGVTGPLAGVVSLGRGVPQEVDDEASRHHDHHHLGHRCAHGPHPLRSWPKRSAGPSNSGHEQRPRGGRRDHSGVYPLVLRGWRYRSGARWRPRSAWSAIEHCPDRRDALGSSGSAPGCAMSARGRQATAALTAFRHQPPTPLLPRGRWRLERWRPGLGSTQGHPGLGQGQRLGVQRPRAPAEQHRRGVRRCP
jgi:hypothetical protein